MKNINFLQMLIGFFSVVFCTIFVVPGFFSLAVLLLILATATPAREHTKLLVAPMLGASSVAFNARGSGPLFDVFFLIIFVLIIIIISIVIKYVKKMHVNLHFMTSFLFSFLVVLSVVIFQWPLLVSFNRSKNKLEMLARAVESGEEVKCPQVTGAFVITEVELDHGRPCLWVSVHPSGRRGFVRNPRNSIDIKNNIYPNNYFNVFYYKKLNLDWSYIDED
jgi:hypothetical protein